MPPISQPKKDKISEQILAYLFSLAPEPKFTSSIAEEIARDEEFTKFLLLELEKKKIIIQVRKNQHGTPYIRRQRWRLTNNTFEVYKKHQF